VPEDSLIGACFVAGTASGPVLYSDVPLSFWGGVDPFTGVVIDTHHPLQGESLTGKILVIPSGRGSCGGSGAIFEMLLNDTAPAALVFCRRESILTLGVVIASELFDRQIPVLQVQQEAFSRLKRLTTANIVDGSIREGADVADPGERAHDSGQGHAEVALSDLDRQFLDGAFGEAARFAMRIVLRAAKLEAARELIDVEMAHIDGVFYQGPASLKYATTLRDLGAKVRVPSTMNAICVDRKQWKRQGVPRSIGEPSEQLADAYEQMGVKPTYTCAPYCLTDHPNSGSRSHRQNRMLSSSPIR
jgi:predicted aconitase with swiveling domain